MIARPGPFQICKTPIKVLMHHHSRRHHGNAHLGKTICQITEPVSCFGPRGLIQIPTDPVYGIEQVIDTSAGTLRGQINDGAHAAELQKPRRRFKASAFARAVPNRPRKTLVI